GSPVDHTKYGSRNPGGGQTDGSVFGKDSRIYLRCCSAFIIQGSHQPERSIWTSGHCLYYSRALFEYLKTRNDFILFIYNRCEPCTECGAGYSIRPNSGAKNHLFFST